MEEKIELLESTTFGGRRFTRKMLVQIQETVNIFSNLSRRELAHTVCEHLQWITPSGSNRIQSCLKALEQMEKGGLITLPVKKKPTKKARQKPIPWTERTKEQPIVSEDLNRLGAIELVIVTEKDDIELWNEYVDRYHYLGYRRTIGESLRYFIVAQNRPDTILGCLLFSPTSTYALSCRDKWIGWKEKDRKKRLNLILCNNRFLILPWVKVKNLASKVLSTVSKWIADDWEERYRYRPVLLETFVNAAKYQGTSYQSANWQCLGQTSGRRDKKEGINKDLYVYPLTHNFRKVLTNHKSIKQLNAPSSKKREKPRIDDPFTRMWQRIADLVYTTAQDYDQKWQLRRRTIDTMLIVLFVFRLVFSKNKQGYGITISELWEQCRKMNYPLPQAKPVAASAFCIARKKLDASIFRTINTEIIETYRDSEADYQWKGRRLFAVDGSKINLPRQLMSDGYALPSQAAHYPQGLLSCLYQLKSKIPYDFDLPTHYDERKAALNHLRVLNANDVVVYDRGYFSYLMLYRHVEQEIDVVFRIQKNSFKVINNFNAGDETDKTVTIDPSSDLRARITARQPEIKIVPLQLRLIKYTIAEETYTLGTTLMDGKAYPAEEFCDLYHSRWGIEELYKVSKGLIQVDEFHAQSERGVKQELFAHFVLITMSRIFANKVENDFADEGERKNIQGDPKHRKMRVNFKNSLVTLAGNLEGLFMRHARFVAETVQTVLISLFSTKQKERPNRSYPRKSMKPQNKWSRGKAKQAAV